MMRVGMTMLERIAQVAAIACEYGRTHEPSRLIACRLAGCAWARRLRAAIVAASVGRADPAGRGVAPPKPRALSPCSPSRGTVRISDVVATFLFEIPKNRIDLSRVSGAGMFGRGVRGI